MRGRNPSDPDDMAVMGLVFTIAATSDIRATKQLVGQLLHFFFISNSMASRIRQIVPI